MLQIYVFGPTEQGFLDLNSNTQFEMEDIDDAFDEDLSIGEFSLPGEIPWSEKNRRLLGFAERLENMAITPDYYRCTVYDDGFPELPEAKMTIIGKVGHWTYLSGKFNVSISSNKGLFGSAIKNKKLTDLELGGKITWASDESRKFAFDVMTGVYPQYNYISFAPVAIEDFIDKGRTDYTTEFLARDMVNNVIVSLVSGSLVWGFGRPKTSDGTAAPIGHSEHNDYFTVPFFKLKFVLKKVFEEVGYIVTGDFIDDAAFDDLVIFNQYGIENYSPTTYEDFNRSILPRNHVPDYTIAEFLKAVLGLFNLFPVFQDGNKVHLIYRLSNLRNKKILSLTNYISKEFETTMDEQMSDNKGYKLAMQWDSNDQYYSDRVKDVSDKTLVANVYEKSVLGTLSIGRTLTTDDIAYVQAENMYYRVADATSSPILWDCYAEKLNDYVQGDGERTVDFNISTLCTYAIFNPTTSLWENKDCVGTRQPGSYINNKGVTVQSKFDLRIFYIRGQTTGFFGVGAPQSLNRNRVLNNVVVYPYSLGWFGDDGLAKVFHLEWQNLKEKTEVVKTNVNIDKKLLQDMRSHNMFEINNVLFLPFKSTRLLPLKNSMEIRLVVL